MGSRLPSVGEASGSIRHGHVRVKDTHASLACAGLANPSEPLWLATSVAAERSTSRAWDSTRVTQARKPVPAHHSASMHPPRALAPALVLTAPHAARLVPTLGQGEPCEHACTRAINAEELRTTPISAYVEQHPLSPPCDDQHEPWSPAQPLVVVHCLGGGHRARRRGASPGRAA